MEPATEIYLRYEDMVDFMWGQKRGIGGKKKNVQFYESFTFGGEEYALYDAVYINSGVRADHDIGKITKIFENADLSRRVKVQWFGRPSEIRELVGEGIEAGQNELFFTCGEGGGVADIYPLEAIVGKCKIVCTSTDIRNPQPSVEALQSAEFVFHRFFDVGECRILDTIDDGKIAGFKVENVFNK